MTDAPGVGRRASGRPIVVSGSRRNPGPSREVAEPNLGARTGRLVARDPANFRERFDIDVRLRQEVTAIDLDRREVVARDLAGGGEVREGFDTLVYATGAVPVRPDWAHGDLDGVFGMQTLDDGTALLEWLERDSRPRRAVVAGGGYIGGGYTTFPGVIGTAVTKVCGLEVGRTGLRERDAAAAGFEFVAVLAESTNRAGYYPGARPMTVKLIAARKAVDALAGTGRR